MTAIRELLISGRRKLECMSEWQFLLWFLANAKFTDVVPEEQNHKKNNFFFSCKVNEMGTVGINDLLIVNKMGKYSQIEFFFLIE